jgi:hypothetical protein
MDTLLKNYAGKSPIFPTPHNSCRYNNSPEGLRPKTLRPAILIGVRNGNPGRKLLGIPAFHIQMKPFAQRHKKPAKLPPPSCFLSYPRRPQSKSPMALDGYIGFGIIDIGSAYSLIPQVLRPADRFPIQYPDVFHFEFRGIKIRHLKCRNLVPKSLKK